MFYTICRTPVSSMVLNRWGTLSKQLLVWSILDNGTGRISIGYTGKGTHDSRLGVFLLLLLFVLNRNMLSHILYSLHLFLCCYLIDGGIVGETNGLFEGDDKTTQVAGQQNRLTPVSLIQSETWSIMIPREVPSEMKLIMIPGEAEANWILNS